MNDTDESVKFVRSHKRCSPEGDVDMARLGAGGGGGRGLWEELSVLLTQFCCEPKIAPKNKVYLKNEESLKLCFKMYVFNTRNWKVAKQNPESCSSLYKMLSFICDFTDSLPSMLCSLHTLPSVSSLLTAYRYPYLTQTYLLSSRLFYPKVSKKSLFQCPWGTSTSTCPKWEALLPLPSFSFCIPAFL